MKESSPEQILLPQVLARRLCPKGAGAALRLLRWTSKALGRPKFNGYTKRDGWELTGMDWNTGETVHRTIFGQDNLGNGAYALIQFVENGDLLSQACDGLGCHSAPPCIVVMDLSAFMQVAWIFGRRVAGR
jgi:hypothetical protein